MKGHCSYTILKFGSKCFLSKHYESLLKSKENVVTETGLHMNRHCVNILGTLWEIDTFASCVGGEN